MIMERNEVYSILNQEVGL